MNNIEVIIPTFTLDDEIELILYKHTFTNLYKKDPTGLWVNCGHLINPSYILILSNKYDFNKPCTFTFKCSLCGEYLINKYINSNELLHLKYGFIQPLLFFSQYWNTNKLL